MRFKQFKITLQENSYTSSTPDELEGMKTAIASKIKELPADDATAKALKEIEELLQHVNAGGRMGMIYDQLEQVNDPTVLAAQKMLARYILSMDASPAERKEFFNAWKSDNIVNVKALLSKKKLDFSQTFNLYSSNKMVKEFVDDVMEISALGQGRGEFGLNVLSKSIWKPEDGKGDLKMKLGSKVLQIECKTTMGGAARFSDQEVRPAEGYEAAAVAINNFVKKSKTYPINVPGYGLNLNKAIEFYQNTSGTERTQFLNLVKKVVSLIFGGREANQDDVNKIVNSIKVGDSGGGLQAWANASFNYYMGRKDDDGVLYTDLNEKSFVFYTEASDLTKQGLRFHAGTPYLSTVKDPGRGAYPQLEITPTTFGGEAAAKALPKVAKQTKQKTDAEYMAGLNNWANQLASRRGISDTKTIRAIAAQTRELLTQRVDSKEIIPRLEKMFPELQVPKTPKMPTQAAAPAVTPAPQQTPQQVPTEQPVA